MYKKFINSWKHIKNNNFYKISVKAEEIGQDSTVQFISQKEKSTRANQIPTDSRAVKTENIQLQGSLASMRADFLPIKFWPARK